MLCSVFQSEQLCSGIQTSLINHYPTLYCIIKAIILLNKSNELDFTLFAESSCSAQVDLKYLCYTEYILQRSRGWGKLVLFIEVT